MTINLQKPNFVDRHIGPDSNQIEEMLDAGGADSMDQFMKETVPSQIRIDDQPDLGDPIHETEYLEHIQDLASQRARSVSERGREASKSVSKARATGERRSGTV